MTDPARHDRAVNLVLVAVLIVTCGTLLLAAVAIPLLLEQGNTLDAQARSDALAGCRSEWAAELATAEAHLDRAESRRDDATFAGLARLGDGDEQGLAEAVAEEPVIQRAILEARRDRDAIDAERSASITLSRRDPDAYLEQCGRRFG
jgi:hypothetical protein